MVHDNSQATISTDETHKMPAKTDSSANRIGKEELKSLIRIEIKPMAETI